VNALPVIQRELRVASRQRSTWLLRWAFAAAAMLALGFGLMIPHVSPQNRGELMLICLSIGAFALSLFTGPFLTADSVSFEKREGTLGLLFLTPLNGSGIVVGKTVCHSAQVACAWLAILPCLFLPVLHGGVLWIEVARLLLALFVAMLLSLAVGIFWSTVSTEARHSVLASAVTVLGVVFLPWAPLLAREMFNQRWIRTDLPAVLSPMTSVVFAFEDNFDDRSPMGRLSGAESFWWSIGITGLVILLLIGLSSLLLPAIWRRSESGARTPSVPRARKRPDRRRIELLAHPTQWLALRYLKEARWVRLLRWLGILVFAAGLFYSLAQRHHEEGFVIAFCIAYTLHLITRIQAVLTATRQLHDDRRSGALELLLVTPQPEKEVIQAHHESVKRSLRPAWRTLLLLNISLQLAVTLGARQLDTDDEIWFIFTAFFTGGLLVTLSDFRTLRWLALRAGLRAQTHLRAAGTVFGLLMGLPWVAFGTAFLSAIQFNNAVEASAFLWLWVVGCLIYNRILEGGVRRWLKPGLRRRVSEGS
jgi:ABC-type transport system involved in multi-copper enzyme maturation permease subunit